MERISTLLKKMNLFPIKIGERARVDPVDLRYNLGQNLLVVSICFHKSLYIGTLTLCCLTLILLMYYFKNLVICWVLWWTLLIPALLRVQFQDYIEKSCLLLSLPPQKNLDT